DPSDERGYTDRIRALSARYPGDAELASIVASRAAEPEEGIAKARQALAIDPRYADAMQVLGEALVQGGRLGEGLAPFEQCIDRVAGTIDCVRDLTSVLREHGRCAEAEVAARRWIARDPSSAQGYAVLAGVLAAEERPKVAVEEALHQRWSRLPEPER